MTENPKIEIQKGLPIPPKPNPPGREAKWPFALLEVGDSFLVPRVEGKCVGAQPSPKLLQAGRRFTARNLPEGIRWWRVE